MPSKEKQRAQAHLEKYGNQELVKPRMRKLAKGGLVSKQTKVDMHIFGLGLQSYAPQVDEAIQLIEKRGQVKGGKVRSVANFFDDSSHAGSACGGS